MDSNVDTLADDDLETAARWGLYVDPRTCTIGYRGRRTYLDGLPLRLLARLATQFNVSCSFEVLKLDVWHNECTTDEAVSRTIRRLRKMLRVHHMIGLTLKTDGHSVMLVLS